MGRFGLANGKNGEMVKWVKWGIWVQAVNR